MENIFKKFQELSEREQKTIEQLGLKMSEETGECSQAILSAVKAKGCDYKGLTFDDVKEEAVDVIIVAASLFFKLGGSLEEMKTICETKALKWEEKSLK